MSNSDRDAIPAPLSVAASLTAVQALLLFGYGILEFSNTSSERVAVGLTSGLFFVGYGMALGWGAWLLSRGVSAARSPIVLSQLIFLGVAWSFRGGETTTVAVVIAGVALVVLAGIFHPTSIARLDDTPARHD